MFRWAFGIALLWYVTFIITVMLGNTDIPHYWPDRLRGLFGGPPFLFWILIQRDTLERWSSATMHLVSLEQMALEKATRFLPVALRPGDPFYRSFTSLELIILFGLGICMEPIIRPWLQGWEGRPSNGFMVAASFMDLVICLCTWKYVKAVLYATSKACHAELKRIKQALHN